MKKTILSFSSCLLLAAFTISCNSNDSSSDPVEKADSTNEAKVDSSTVNRPEIRVNEETAKFLVDAANGGMAEVQLGQLAREKGVSQGVKDFGAMMVRDHSAANQQVKTLAAERNVTLPDSVGGDAHDVLTDLRKKTGKDFDKAYAKAMVKDHETDIKMFKDASDKVNDAAVKTFVDNTIPTLQHHLESIKTVQKTLK